MSVKVITYFSSFKVRFKKDASDVAMVQMRSKDHVESCIRILNGLFLFEKTITIECSPDIDLERCEKLYPMWNTTMSYVNLANCKHFWFLRANTSKKGEVAPSKVPRVILHILYIRQCFCNIYHS
jgi:hypothetical protein